MKISPLALGFAAGALGLPVAAVSAHDSPEHVIEALSERIDTDGASARLLTRRAYEHQTLGNGRAAVADFRAALELEPRSHAAMVGCVETLLHQGALREAESLAQRGLGFDDDVGRQAPLHALRARINVRQQRWPEALASWRKALRSPRAEIDWFLGEAECLAMLGRDKEHCAALARAMQRNPSVVLRRAWIRALVDAGDIEPALREIEAGLARSRWNSAWLLLRARVHAQRQDTVRQEADASAALTEILSRLNPDRPDPHLVSEAELARDLMAGK